MLENAINIDMEESSENSIIQQNESLNELRSFRDTNITKTFVNKMDINALKELNNVTDIESVNVFNIMIVLEKIKKIFLERREFVQKKVNALDYQIEQEQLSLAFIVDIDDFKKSKESIDELVIERKKLLLEKQLMKKLDIGNQFTYGMIGMGIQSFKNITKDLDWEEMKL